jgi:hypothetical protein
LRVEEESAFQSDAVSSRWIGRSAMTVKGTTESSKRPPQVHGDVRDALALRSAARAARSAEAA